MSKIDDDASIKKNNEKFTDSVMILVKGAIKRTALEMSDYADTGNVKKDVEALSRVIANAIDNHESNAICEEWRNSWLHLYAWEISYCLSMVLALCATMELDPLGLLLKVEDFVGESYDRIKIK